MFGVAGLRVSLEPELERRSRLRFANSFAAWSAFYVLGHVAGGAAVGGILGAMGGLLPGGVHWGATAGLPVLCALWALQEFGRLRLPMPQLHRQVQRNWMHRRHWNLVAVGYGVQLGCGAATRISSPTTYAVMCFALLSGSWWKGSLIMAVFGLLRSWAPVAMGRRVSSPEASVQYAMLFSANEARIKAVSGSALLVAGLVIGATTW